MTDKVLARAHGFGICAMAVAALSLIVAVAHLSFGPFAPQKPIERTIAETAVAIKEAAKRVIAGEPDTAAAAPRRSRWNIDRVTDAAVLVLAACAIFLAIVALIRREQLQPAMIGFSLGTGVLLMTWLQWIALIICGAIILFAIITSLGDILPS